MSAPATRTRAQMQAAVATAQQANADAVAAGAAAAAARAPGAAALDMGAILAQLLQQNALQAALTTANAELAAADHLAQLRRAGAGAIPLFSGARSGNELAVNTWLDALESWFALAHIDTSADAERIEVLGAALRDSAQQWWAATRAADAAVVAAGGASTIGQWSTLVAAMRKQYLPQDPARWAIQQLTALTSSNNADVQAYTTRFHQLNLMVTGPRNDLQQVLSYEQGLPDGYREKSAEQQHTTLDAAVSAALARWNAKSVARAQSRSSGSRHSGAARLHNTQTGGDSDDEAEAADPQQQQQRSSGAAPSAADNRVAALEQQMHALLTQMQGSGHSAGGQVGRGRGGRDRQREGAPSRSRSKTPGVSDELAKQRLRNRVCIKCGLEGHYARDCKNELKTN